MNKFAKLFYNPEQGQPKSQPATTPQAPVNPIISVPKTQAPVEVDMNDKKNEEIRNQLSTALHKASAEGQFDYLKFIEAVDEQSADIPVESTRFKVVFKTCSVLGISTNVLINSANKYLEVLINEEFKFKDMVAAQTKEAVDRKVAELEEINGEIANLAEQIKQINARMEELQTMKTSLSNEVEDNKAKIQKTTNTFMAVVDIFKKKIQSDIEKIKNYTGTN